MFNLDADQVTQILVDELGYSSADADLFLRDFPPIRDPLAGAVQRWLQDRTVPDVQVAGLSIKEVMKVRDCHFLMAVRYLNRILDPRLSKDRRQRMVENLRQPIARW